MQTRAIAKAVALVVTTAAASVWSQEPPRGGAAGRRVLRVAAIDAPSAEPAVAGPSSGFATDIMEAVAQRAGLDLRYVSVPSEAEAYTALADSVVDVVPNVGAMADRQAQMDFSHTIYVSQVRIFVRAGTSNVSDAESLVGRPVARVARNGPNGVDSSQMDDTTFATPEAALGALIAGHVDAMIYPQAMMWNLANSLGLEGLIKSVGPPLLEVPRALAVRKGDDALLARLDPAIDALLAEPVYAAIVRRWFADPPPYWTAGRVLTWAGIVLLILVIGHHIRVWHLNRDLTRSRDQLRALTAHLNTTREDEQKTLARELHDEIGQAMAVLKMDLASLREDGHNGNGLAERYDAMVSLADSAIEAGHRICTRLRPDILDRLGLEAAVEWTVDDFQERTGIRCTLEGADSDMVVTDEASTAFYRILQEALSNVIRHADASSVAIRMGLGCDPRWMEVEDDGCGATRAQIQRPDALGVLGMRERAAALGGTVTIEARPGEGTVVRVEIPRGAPRLRSASTR